MSHTTETVSAAPAQKGSAGTPQNLPSDLTVAYGRVITAATARQAADVGLTISAEARWPESAHDHTPPALPGFIVSSFSPITAETAARVLRGRPADAPVTAVIIATARGDRQSAAHVARTVADGGLLGPLLFFQSVPNAVAGHIATRWNLTGPVVCLADSGSALQAAAQLIEDGDADEALLVRVEQVSEGHDQAHAVLLRATTPLTTTTDLLGAPDHGEAADQLEGAADPSAAVEAVAGIEVAGTTGTAGTAAVAETAEPPATTPDPITPDPTPGAHP